MLHGEEWFGLAYCYGIAHPEVFGLKPKVPERSRRKLRGEHVLLSAFYFIYKSYSYTSGII
jgi:hypothetical protein